MNAIKLKSKLLLLNPLAIALSVLLSTSGCIKSRTSKLLFLDRGGEPVYLNEIFRDSGFDEMAEAIAKGNFYHFRALFKKSKLVNLEGRSGITLLWLAVKFQQEEIVEFLLDRGASVDIEIYWTSSIIGMAAEGDSAILKRLLAAGASIDTKSGGMDGLLPIHHAVETESNENLKILLEAGADVNSRTETGLFPLLLSDRNIELFLYLLEAGADPTITNNYGVTAFPSLLRNNKTPEHMKEIARVREWLTAHGYDIEDLAKNQMKERQQSREN